MPTAVYHAINSDDVDKIMQHPMTSIASDGPMTVFGVGSPHLEHMVLLHVY